MKQSILSVLIILSQAMSKSCYYDDVSKQAFYFLNKNG